MVSIFLSYLLYTQFFITFFGYWTHANWYNGNRFVDYIQLSHEPNRWGWGAVKRDHFSYHKSSTVFWFKNDGPMAGAMLLINFFFFIMLFLLYLYWVILLRRVYSTEEFSYTYTIYSISALKQFFYFFLLLYLFVLFSYLVCYWRTPIEYVWLTPTSPWLVTFFDVFCTYWHHLLPF